MSIFALGFYTFIFIIVALFIKSCVRIVNQQTVSIVETLGKFDRTLEAGLNVILPFPISSIVHTVDLRVQQVRANLDVKTSDNTFVQLPVSIMYSVMPDKVAESYYKLEEPAKQITSWTLNSVKAAAASMTLQDLFEDREGIVEKVQSDVQNRFSSYGFKLESILVEQPNVNEKLQQASNRVVEALREQQAATAEGEALKIKTIAQAQAEAAAQIARSEGIAQSRSILAQSLRDNIEIVKETGADIDGAMDMLLTINRYDMMRDAADSGNMVILDTNNPQTGMGATTLKKVSH